MCIKGKQILKLMAAGLDSLGPALAQDDGIGAVGGVLVGDNLGGFTDRVWVVAPPETAYVLELAPGSFLDCGTGQSQRQVDGHGRDEAPLLCGVTVTEILHLPDVGTPARITFHF